MHWSRPPYPPGGVAVTGIAGPGWLIRALLLVGIAFLAGCSAGGDRHGAGVRTVTPAVTAAAAAASTPAFPLTVAGTDGGTVRLAKAPERIVSLSAGITETLFAFGAGPAVVGVDRFADYPEAVKALPRVEYSRPSVETLVALRPDLVLASGRQKDAVAAMQAAGLTVLMLDEPTGVQGVIDRVRLFGRITGRGEDADRLAREMEARVRALTDRLAPVDRGPRVYHEISPLLFTASPASFVGDLYTLLRARNIAADGPTPFPQLSAEVIVQRDPEVIVLADVPATTLEEARNRPGWGTVSAIRTGRVHLLTPEQIDWVSRPGPRLVEGLELLAKLLYPEMFP